MSEFSLVVKAGEAFGSGGHPSTQGALMALEMLSPPIIVDDRHPRKRGSGVRSEPEKSIGRKTNRSINTILDIGCGSGVLAITAAHLWPTAEVLAGDIAQEAVDFTLENAKENGMKARIRAVRADGYAHEAIKAGAPYDLILCNVLAEVIVRLAHDLAKHQQPGGIAILSGILAWHAQAVIHAHEAAGYRLLDTIIVKDWKTLVVEKQ